MVMPSMQGKALPRLCCKDSWLAFIYVALFSKEQWVLDDVLFFYQ